MPVIRIRCRQCLVAGDKRPIPPAPSTGFVHVLPWIDISCCRREKITDAKPPCVHEADLCLILSTHLWLNCDQSEKMGKVSVTEVETLVTLVKNGIEIKENSNFGFQPSL